MKDIQGRLRVRVAVFACVAAVALGIDQLTKMWAQQALGDGRTVPLIPGLLSLTLVHNPGASLGLGSGSTWLISLLAVVACVVMAVLAVAMCFLFAMRICIKARGSGPVRVNEWIGFALFSLAGAYLHYYAVLVVTIINAIVLAVVCARAVDRADAVAGAQCVVGVLDSFRVPNDVDPADRLSADGRGCAEHL